MSSCQKTAVIDKHLYNNTSTNNYLISNAVINGDCLQLTYGSSGCSGNTWVADLIDASEVAETNPPQRHIKLKLTNTELCAAVFSKTATFDLTPLRVLGSNSVSLVLTGYSGALIYNY